MSLVRIDLPTPAQLRGPWAALAAVNAARGWADSCTAETRDTTWPVWHYDDGGGNWADLHLISQDQAVLVGNDHEYSQTYYGPAAEYFDEPETDLLAGAPPWWAQPLPSSHALYDWVGFVYGYDGRQWARARYEVDDGFHSVGLPACDLAATGEHIRTLTADAPGRPRPPDPTTVDALILAGPDLTAELLATIVGPCWDTTAGIVAAQKFRQP